MNILSLDFDGCTNLADFHGIIKIVPPPKPNIFYILLAYAFTLFGAKPPDFLNTSIEDSDRDDRQFFIDEIVDEFLKGNTTLQVFNRSQNQKTGRRLYVGSYNQESLSNMFKILEKIQEAVDADDKICIGSNRQSEDIDNGIGKYKKEFAAEVHGTAVEQFSRIIARLQQAQQAKKAKKAPQARPGKKIRLPERDGLFKEKVLAEATRLKATTLEACFDSDLKSVFPEGAPVDDTKFLLLLNQMHKFQQPAPCTLTFLDDRSDIVNRAHTFFVKNPSLIPDGMTLKLEVFCPIRGVFYDPVEITGMGKNLGDNINAVISNVCKKNSGLLNSTSYSREQFNPSGLILDGFEGQLVNEFKRIEGEIMPTSQSSTTIQNPTTILAELGRTLLGFARKFIDISKPVSRDTIGIDSTRVHSEFKEVELQLERAERASGAESQMGKEVRFSPESIINGKTRKSIRD